MKRLICILLLLCLLSACGQAEEISELQRRAQADLTEVLGFTEEEAARFVFETQADGSVRYWDPAQPDLVYTEYYSDDAWHAVLATTPYDTQFSARTPENTVAESLRAARREGWFLRWDESARKALLDACGGVVWAPTELCFAQTAGQALQALFVGFYGPEMGWTKGVTARRDAAMAEYGLVPEELPFRVPGIRRTENTEPIGAVRTITLFDGEIPEELTGVLADPHLAGWTLETGALLTRDWGSMHVPTGGGLAILERDGTRQLIQLGLLDGRWVAFPLGADALYQGVPCRVTYDGLHRYFAIQYQLSDTRTAVFYVSPSLNDAKDFVSAFCTLEAYERMDTATGEAVWIAADSFTMPTWKWENVNGETIWAQQVLPYLGLYPITDFPTTPEDAARALPALPEGYTLVSSVNLRQRTSSHSTKLGELCSGTMVPVLDTLPGDRWPWIHTRVGQYEGYVTALYTLEGDGVNYQNLSLQPVAKAKKEISLKKGTGLLSGTAATLPAGTKMHVVMADDSWLYVDVPRGEAGPLMDPEGMFGYVRRSDVWLASMLCQLDWME